MKKKKKFLLTQIKKLKAILIPKQKENKKKIENKK